MSTRESPTKSPRGVMLLPSHEFRSMTLVEFTRMFPDTSAVAVNKFDDWYLSLFIAERPDNLDAPVNRVASSLYWHNRERKEGMYVRGPVFVCDDYRELTGEDFRPMLLSLKAATGEVCRVCAKNDSGLKRCGACKAMYYCSKECAAKDWRRHKRHCTKRPSFEWNGKSEVENK